MEAVGCAESNSFYIECSEFIKYNRLTFIVICSMSFIAKSEPNMNALTFVSHSSVLGVSHWRVFEKRALRKIFGPAAEEVA
jgi:hypothetical protein